MCFAHLICAQAELQPLEGNARAATLKNFLDLASSIQLYDLKCTTNAITIVFVDSVLVHSHIYTAQYMASSKELTGSKGKLASIPQGDQQAKQVEHVPVICESLGVSGTVGTVIIMDTQITKFIIFF